VLYTLGYHAKIGIVCLYLLWGKKICLLLVFVMPYIGRCLATADPLSKDSNQISVI